MNSELRATDRGGKVLRDGLRLLVCSETITRQQNNSGTM